MYIGCYIKSISQHFGRETEYKSYAASLYFNQFLLILIQILPLSLFHFTRKKKNKQRHSLKFQYSALDSGLGTSERSPRERANRDRALSACQDWLQKSQGRYEIMVHLDDIGCRPNKNWFLLNDTTVRTDRLMSLVQLPADCVALEEMPPSECPKGVLMELLASLQHPYIYPVLDLGIFFTNQTPYACLVMPFNVRGSLKDLIYKVSMDGLSLASGISVSN